MSASKSQRISYDKIRRMDYSKISEDLFIGTTPTVADYEFLRELGVRLVINMRWEFRPPPDLSDPLLHFLWLRTFDSPVFPIPMQALQRGARDALETIRTFYIRIRIHETIAYRIKTTG